MAGRFGPWRLTKKERESRLVRGQTGGCKVGEGLKGMRRFDFEVQRRRGRAYFNIFMHRRGGGYDIDGKERGGD